MQNQNFHSDYFAEHKDFKMDHDMDRTDYYEDQVNLKSRHRGLDLLQRDQPVWEGDFNDDFEDIYDFEEYEGRGRS